jgi:hypothetical protein
MEQMFGLASLGVAAFTLLMLVVVWTVKAVIRRKRRKNRRWMG